MSEGSAKGCSGEVKHSSKLQHCERNYSCYDVTLVEFQILPSQRKILISNWRGEDFELNLKHTSQFIFG